LSAIVTPPFRGKAGMAGDNGSIKNTFLSAC